MKTLEPRDLIARVAAGSLALLLALPALVHLFEAADTLAGGSGLHSEPIQFGAESMVAHGGWAYRSAAHYAGSALLIGALFLLGAVAAAKGVWGQAAWRVSLVSGAAAIAGVVLLRWNAA